jgi:hypothetical protein
VSINNSDNELENDQETLEHESLIEEEDIHAKDEKLKAGSAVSGGTLENKDIDGISKENWIVLEKIKSVQREDHLKVNITIH